MMIVLASASMLLLIGDHYDLEYFVYTMVDNYQLEHLVPIDNYTFSTDDSKHGEKLDKYFNIVPGDGDSISFTQQSSPLKG